MRFLMQVRISTEAGNQAVKGGRPPKALESVMELVKPEAAYFLLKDGMRTALIFFTMPDPSQIPMIVEPLFQELQAHVEILPVMNQDDLHGGLQRLAQQSG